MSFRQLFLHHFKKSLLGSTVNVVSIFAAIHLTRLLKRVYKSTWQHDEDDAQALIVRIRGEDRLSREVSTAGECKNPKR